MAIIGSFKYFIGYINNGQCFSKSIMQKNPQINGYVKYIDNNNKYVDLLVHDKSCLKKYNELWDKIRKLLKEFDSEPMYDDKYIKTKIKIYNNRVH